MRHVTEDDNLPTLFFLLHPPDDIAPLIRIGSCEPSLATDSRSRWCACAGGRRCASPMTNRRARTRCGADGTEPTEWWAPDAGELTMAATPHSLSRCSVGPSSGPAHGSQIRSEGGTPLPRSRNNSRLNASATLHSAQPLGRI